MISRNFDCKHPFLCPVCAIIARSELSYLTTLISFSLVFFDFLAFSYASIMKNAVRTLAVKLRVLKLFQLSDKEIVNLNFLPVWFCASEQQSVSSKYTVRPELAGNHQRSCGHWQSLRSQQRCGYEVHGEIHRGVQGHDRNTSQMRCDSRKCVIC